MAEILEVEEVPEIKNIDYIKVTSINELKRIAEQYNVPLILKKKDEHYLFVEHIEAPYFYKD